MGGIGSSRWKDHERAPRVEDAHQLDVMGLEPALQHDRITGILRWTDPRTEEVTAEFVFSLEPVSRDASRCLVIEPGDNRRRQSVRLERAQRGWHSAWIFLCPTFCGRAVRKLYSLPKWRQSSGPVVFCCRKCLGLSYRSTQTHDSRVDFARRDPQGFIQSRATAPKTSRSQAVTGFLVMEALDPCRPGRGWGRRSINSGTRAFARLRQDFIDRWGFALEETINHVPSE